MKKIAQRKYKCLVLRRDKSYVVKQKLSDSTKKFSGTDIKKMIEFFFKNIFVMIGRCVFKRQ